MRKAEKPRRSGGSWRGQRKELGKDEASAEFRAGLQCQLLRVSAASSRASLLEPSSCQLLIVWRLGAEWGWLQELQGGQRGTATGGYTPLMMGTWVATCSAYH